MKTTLATIALALLAGCAMQPSVPAERIMLGARDQVTISRRDMDRYMCASRSLLVCEARNTGGHSARMQCECAK